MDLNENEMPPGTQDKFQKLGEKLKNLAEDMRNLDKRLEKEKQYFSPKIIEKSAYSRGLHNVCSNSYHSTENMSTIYGTGDASTFREASDILHGGQIKDLCNRIGPISKSPSIVSKEPEISDTKPKLFFTWNSDLKEFKSKLIQKKLSKILEGGESFTKDSLAEKLKTPFCDYTESEDESSRSTLGDFTALAEPECISDEEEELANLLNEDKSTLEKFENKLKEVQQKCMSELKSIDKDYLAENIFIGNENIANREKLEMNIVGTEVINYEKMHLPEDLVIDCFKVPDLTDYKSVPFSQVVKELETLESMLKTMDGIDIPNNVLTDGNYS